MSQDEPPAEILRIDIETKVELRHPYITLTWKEERLPLNWQKLPKKKGIAATTQQQLYITTYKRQWQSHKGNIFQSKIESNL